MSRPIVVAEISANHLGSRENAEALVWAVAQSGASHVKFQTYTADTMTINCQDPAFRISDDHALWAGRSLFELYDEAHTPWEWHPFLFDLSRELGLVPFSSPFDRSAVDFLETLNTSLYKIASMEIGDLPLIRYVAETGKPVVISTGAASLREIDEAVETATEGGCGDLTLLLCTSSYPAPVEDTHLRRMTLLMERYNLPVGFSDHTVGIGASVAAVALGASMLERHVTLSRDMGGPDAAFSLEPTELADLVVASRAASAALGMPDWRELPSESESTRLKRSLYVVEDVHEGAVFTLSNVRSIRPAGGLPPRYLELVLGSRANKNIKRGTPLSEALIDGPLI